MTLRHRILTGTTTERDALEFESLVENNKSRNLWYFIYGVLVGAVLGGGIVSILINL